MKMYDWTPLTLEAEDHASFLLKFLAMLFMVAEWALVVFVTVAAIKLGWSIK